jgi:hypothetical protein
MSFSAITETFLAHRTDPAFGKGVGVRCVELRVNNLDGLRLKNSVEGGGKRHTTAVCAACNYSWMSFSAITPKGASF